MNIQDSIVFVTGANRGFGLALLKELRARGARKVYAGMRTPVELGLPGVVTVRLDVTRPDEVAAAARQAADTTVLINNAGIAELVEYADPDSEAALRRMLETNLHGVVRVSQAFAPVLAANGGGSLLNVLSVVSWITTPGLSPYAASKAAAWSYTNALRTALRAQGTRVSALHVGLMDTELTRDIPLAKSDPRAIAAYTLDALAEGHEEILADELSRMVKRGLSAHPGVYLAPPQR